MFFTQSAHLRQRMPHMARRRAFTCQKFGRSFHELTAGLTAHAPFQAMEQAFPDRGAAVALAADQGSIRLPSQA